MKDRRINSLQNSKVLSSTQNTHAFVEFVTPRIFMKMLPYINLSTGIFRINKVYKHKENTSYTLTEDSICNMELCCHLTKEEFALLKKHMNHRTLVAGETINHTQTKNSLCVVLSGKYEFSMMNYNEKPILLKVLNPGTFFCDPQLLNAESEEKVRIRTIEKGKIVIINNIDVINKLLQNEQFRYFLNTTLMDYKNDYNTGEHKANLISSYTDEPVLPKSYIKYDEYPIEIELDVIQSVLGIHTRIHELYNEPHSQLESQLKILIMNILEREEWEIFNNSKHGLINQVEFDRTITTRNGAPTPDDMDNLLELMWKEPSVIVAHPKAIAAFGRECTKCGVPPVVTNMFGTNVITWRGIPIVPCDKIEIMKRSDGVAFTNILAMRLGLDKQGVFGLQKSDIAYGGIPSLSVRQMSTDDMSILNYLVTKYYNVAVPVSDAIAMLSNVEIGHYHD